MSNRARVLLVAGFLLALVLGCATFERYGAPKFRDEGPHLGASKMTEEKCFSCHLEGKDGAPKAPESMIGRKDCTWCHLRG